MVDQSTLLKQAVREAQFRQRVKTWLPDVGDPPDLDRVAFAIFEAIGLQPSEFHKLNPTQRLRYVEHAIASSGDRREEAKAPNTDSLVDPSVVAAKSTDAPSPRAKRSTTNGDAKLKLEVALTAHHKYDQGRCANKGPIGCRELARAADVSPSRASEWLKAHFGSLNDYKAFCYRDFGKVATFLKAINGDYTVVDTYGASPDSGCRDD